MAFKFTAEDPRKWSLCSCAQAMHWITPFLCITPDNNEDCLVAAMGTMTWIIRGLKKIIYQKK